MLDYQRVSHMIYRFIYLWLLRCPSDTADLCGAGEQLTRHGEQFGRSPNSRHLATEDPNGVLYGKVTLWL